jgi:hypothetical protein
MEIPSLLCHSNRKLTKQKERKKERKKMKTLSYMCVDIGLQVEVAPVLGRDRQREDWSHHVLCTVFVTHRVANT